MYKAYDSLFTIASIKYKQNDFVYNVSLPNITDRYFTHMKCEFILLFGLSYIFFICVCHCSLNISVGVCHRLLKQGIYVSLRSTSFLVRSCCGFDVMCSVCCVSHQNSYGCIRPLGSHISACLCCCVVYVCVFRQTALHHCHSQKQRKTLMLFYPDTYLTPLSLSLTLLQADVRIHVFLTFISHQTDNQTLT